MQIPEQLIPHIESFRNGDVSKGEILDKLAGLVTEAQLNDYINLYDQSMELIDIKTTRDELGSIHKELFGEEVNSTREIKRSVNHRYWLMAASVILIAVFAFLITQSNTNRTFSDVFIPYKNLVTLRGDEVELGEAMRLYSMGQFEGAMEIFNQFAPTSYETEYYFYKGVTAMALENFNLAALSFEKIGTTESNPFWQQTKWYLALTYWQSGEVSESITLLKAIGPNEYEYESAQTLIEQISN